MTFLEVDVKLESQLLDIQKQESQKDAGKQFPAPPQAKPWRRREVVRMQIEKLQHELEEIAKVESQAGDEIPFTVYRVAPAR